MLRRYLETNECRWQQLLAYCGEVLDHPCRHCDRCTAQAKDNDLDACSAAAPTAGFVPEDRVRFGPGIGLSRDEDRLTVLFDTAALGCSTKS